MYRLAIILFLWSNYLMAQKDSANSSGFEIHAFVDAYYAYDFNRPVSGNRAMMANGQSHVYSHNRHNEFAINEGLIRVKYVKDKLRGALGLQAGTYPQANYAKEPIMLRSLFEAYVGYGITKNIYIDAGIFSSHIGFESAISMDNLTLSRSIMADNTPYYESGVKLTYEVSKKLSLQGLILNGWQNITENNKNKALGTQIQYKPTDKILFNSSTFFGKETPSFDTVATMRYFHNFYTKIDLNKVSLIAAFDLGFQEKAVGKGTYCWYNPNFIISYAVFSKVKAAARLEYYHDRYRVMVNSGTLQGFQNFAPSLNFDFSLSENMLWRIEGRIFNSTYKIYQRSNSVVSQDLFLISSLAIKI